MTDPYLPPGVRVTDIPGNRPQDEARWRAHDRAVDDVEYRLRSLDFDEWMVEVAAEAICDDERFDDFVESRVADGYDEPPSGWDEF